MVNIVSILISVTLKGCASIVVSLFTVLEACVGQQDGCTTVSGHLVVRNLNRDADRVQSVSVF